MKTLNEVIKVFEDCFGDGRIVISPLEVEPDYGADALHYLKMYRSGKIEYENNLKQWSELGKNVVADYEEVKKKHIEAIKALENEREMYLNAMALWEENPPLTWDELITMEGKPVWMEYNLHLSDKDARSRSRMWIIVQNIMPWRQDDELIYYSGFVFGKEEIGETWQAYRKERE